MEPDDLLCSRNARSQAPLVGRARWKINQPPSLMRRPIVPKGRWRLEVGGWRQKERLSLLTLIQYSVYTLCCETGCMARSLSGGSPQLES